MEKEIKSSAIVYDESKIKTLSSLDHIRLRTGMYIGRLGDGSNVDDGIYILLKEVIDNGIDEFIMGFGKQIVVEIKDTMVKVRDFGRGIPLGKIIDCVSIINTGAKYNDEVFQFSVGLNGVGTKAVNALSSKFRVVAYREGKFAEAVFERGTLLSQKTGKSSQPDGTLVEFVPDEQIFGEYEFNPDFVEQRIWNYAYLNSGLSLEFNGKLYSSRKGLYDLLSEEVGSDLLYDIIHYKGKQLEFSVTHTNNYGENYFSYVNGQYTSAGGAHLSAFREGILKGVNEYYKKNYSGIDARDGIAGAIAIKLMNPVFESQTKNKLGNTDIRGWIVQEVKAAIIDFLMKNTISADKLSNKIISNEKLRKELNDVKKGAREAAKKISLKIPNLKDCKFHLGDVNKKSAPTTIFLTEGQSASGSMISARDVYSQAIFSLRGKVLNVYGKKRTEIYKNEELYNLMMALGIENGVEGLRYDRIVIATDADFDGFHIRNLLLTFFLNFFEDTIISGHLYILETPLFRVRNKVETIYCYNASERDTAKERLRGPEITRFKGLGEISPKEFGQFIGRDIRLVPVSVRAIHDIRTTLEFYMGKNTPERRQFIMENLI
ncbi:MAG: type IIA DNA topoisomerase subunit B [Spirochaetia bacterium]|nr:type IIA DNA topoisomerase subunit B [Spirochaetia bacterium]